MMPSVLASKKEEKLYNKLISGHGGIKSSYFDCNMLSAWNALQPFLGARSGEGLPKYRMLGIGYIYFDCSKPPKGRIT